MHSPGEGPVSEGSRSPTSHHMSEVENEFNFTFWNKLFYIYLFCSRFIKGCCLLDNCLLSHNVTLSKMPTCKFFLAKMCVRPNCPYLHKKVNAKTAICEQFVAGFCPAAEKVNTFYRLIEQQMTVYFLPKCSKRHEFLCPEFESKGVCEQPRCKLPHKTKSVLKADIKTNKAASTTKSTDEIVGLERYYYGQGSTRTDQPAPTQLSLSDPLTRAKYFNEQVEQVIPSRPKLGVLPSFIPIDKKD